LHLPQCGGPGKRETNTMPQWAGSCWYYLRYIDPKNSQAFVGADKEKHWAPVDLYVGGAEHAVLHLLYSRFWHKVLFDLGHVSQPEPFMRLVNQGMILGEDGQRCRSHAATSSTRRCRRRIRADAFRMYEMFMGPLEATKPWNTKASKASTVSSAAFGRLYCDEDGKSLLDDSIPDGKLVKALHQTIKKVTHDTETLAFNTAIAQMMMFVNEVTAVEKRPRAVLEPFILLLSPYAPHLAEELWERSGHHPSLAYMPWPMYVEALLKESTVTVVLQVNGKVRDRVDVPADAPAELFGEAGPRECEVQESLAGKQVKKVIVVPASWSTSRRPDGGTGVPPIPRKTKTVVRAKTSLPLLRRDRITLT